MLFKNLIENLGGIPTFSILIIKDKNPISKAVKERLIEPPNKPMRILHKRLIGYLRNLNIPLPFATCGRKYQSIVKSIKRHKHNRYLYSLDISNAYLNTSGEKLAVILCQIDENLSNKEKETYEFLKSYCLSPVFKDGLAVGAPASVDLFNIYAGVLLDQPLSKLCKQYSLTYTRYLDDLLFSSSKVPIGKKKRKKIRKIIENANFQINPKKSKIYDLKKNPIIINGIGLEYGGRIFLPRHYLRKITGLIYKKTNSSVSTNANVINGMMGAYKAISPFPINRIEIKLLNRYKEFKKTQKKRY